MNDKNNKNDYLKKELIICLPILVVSLVFIFLCYINTKFVCVSLLCFASIIAVHSYFYNINQQAVLDKYRYNNEIVRADILKNGEASEFFGYDLTALTKEVTKMEKKYRKQVRSMRICVGLMMLMFLVLVFTI